MAKNLPANAGDVDSIPGCRSILWSRKWQPTTVFLPGKSHGQRRATVHGFTKNQANDHTHSEFPPVSDKSSSSSFMAMKLLKSTGH